MGAIKGKITKFSEYYTDAYAIAVRNGFDGTEEEWLASLVGKDYVLTDADRAEIAALVEADIGLELDEIIAYQNTIIEGGAAG